MPDVFSLNRTLTQLSLYVVMSVYVSGCVSVCAILFNMLSLPSAVDDVLSSGLCGKGGGALPPSNIICTLLRG